MRTFNKVSSTIFLFTLTILLKPPTAVCDQKLQIGHPPQDEVNIQKDLSTEEIKALDTDLANALKLYYNEDYTNALPVFQNISSRFQTLDLILLMGKCEAKTGAYDPSIVTFQQLLSENPTLHRVRLDLADSLILSGRYDEAKEELEKIRTASVSRPILDEVDKRFAHIARIKKFHWGVNLFLGGEYDDNINAGPDRNEIDTIDGKLGLSDEQKKTDSYNFITELRYCARYDLGKPRGFVWSGEADFYYSKSEEDSDFDFLSLNLSTGPWWVYVSGLFKVPVGYTDTRYGEEHLSGTFYFRPDIEHFFTRNFSLQSSYMFAIENYTQSAYREYDNTLNRVSIGPNIYLDNMRHILSGSLSLEHQNADADRTSFDAVSIAFSYFTKLPANTELLLTYIWRERQYDGHSQYYEDDRVDRRNTFIAAISHEFPAHFTLSFEFKYIDNTSNDELLDFNKTVYSLKVGKFF
ncbi:MAG: surface lipoprotein assembly modifier [Pseudomonadota bacterium]